ncbi:MAG: iron chaperone [Planctomycetaceae bacterium]
MAAPTTVDGYMASLPTEVREAMEQIRRTVRATAPEATETISYRMPAFKDRGRILVYYAAFKDHCSIFPASEGVREALGDTLTPYLSGKGTIRFPLDRKIPVAFVKKVVKARLAENEAARRRR